MCPDARNRLPPAKSDDPHTCYERCPDRRQHRWPIRTTEQPVTVRAPDQARPSQRCGGDRGRRARPSRSPPRPPPPPPTAKARILATLASLHARDAVPAAARRASAGVQLRVARRSLGVAQRNLARRLRDLYVEGDTPPLEVLLGATSLGDAITLARQLRRAADQDRAWIRQRRALRRTVARLSQRSPLAAARWPSCAPPSRRGRGRLDCGRRGLHDVPLRQSSPSRHGDRRALVPGTVSPRRPDGAHVIRGATRCRASRHRHAGGHGVAVDPAVVPLGTQPRSSPATARRSPPTPARAIRGIAHRRLVPHGSKKHGHGEHDRNGHDPAEVSAAMALLQAARGGHEAAKDSEGGPTVLLVDDHDLFRAGLRTLLEEQGVAHRRRGALTARRPSRGCASTRPTSC